MLVRGEGGAILAVEKQDQQRIRLLVFHPDNYREDVNLARDILSLSLSLSKNKRALKSKSATKMFILFLNKLQILWNLPAC